MFDPFAKLPPAAKEPISVVLHVRNQGAALAVAVTAWCDFLDHLGQGYELLVVDDGSTDDTAPKLSDLAGKRPHIRPLRHEQPRGFGASLRTALAEARHPLFFYSALDYGYSPSDLRKLLDRIDDVQLATGVRVGTPAPKWVVYLGRLYRGLARVLLGNALLPAAGWLGAQAAWRSWLAFVLFGTRVWDIDSAFKLIRRSALVRMPIQSDGDFVHTEILAKANFLGCTMDEVPIAAKSGPFAAMAPPAAGPSRGKDLSRMFFHPSFGTYTPDPAPALPSST